MRPLINALCSCAMLVTLANHAQSQATEPTPEAYQLLARMHELRAQEGDAQAAYDLGFLYNSGLGVDKSLPEAFRWYLVAAKRGLLEAQDKVAMFYSVGVGTPKNDELAYLWTIIAQYNGGQNLSSQIVRLENALTAETRERAQNNASRCIESSYAEC